MLIPSNCLTFTIPPKDFNVKLEVASCYCECEGKILILKRHPHKSQGNTWGVPAGKLELGETAKEALSRELNEELGLKLEQRDFKFIQTLYIRHPQFDFAYHMFYKRFYAFPHLILEFKEHTEARWVTVEEALSMPLMAGEQDTLNYYQQWQKSQLKKFS